jgi:hypothetical protein
MVPVRGIAVNVRITSKIDTPISEDDKFFRGASERDIQVQAQLSNSRNR